MSKTLNMADLPFVRRVYLRSSPFLAVTRVSLRNLSPAAASGGSIIFISTSRQQSQYTHTDTETKDGIENNKGNWFTLPPFTSSINGAALGKELSGSHSTKKNESQSSGADSITSTKALKWVLRCCPHVPRSLIQKLFRLRQVRKECSSITTSDVDISAEERRLKRVAAKDSMELGDRIYLPITVQALPSERIQCLSNEAEMNFLRSLELYKDPAIIIINKPPGLPVQGGIGVKRSLDELAEAYLKYDSLESPRLVHRLDRDSSGILVLGRTQLSATVLHSIFREKTFGASNYDLNSCRILHRKYWALVIGSPRRPAGLISVPLGKVIVDNGKSERITVIDNDQTTPSQHAITRYRVVAPSCHGYTWLELSPLTGRKHQLRVHCAEVLGTPIVGDYKYGWQAHRKWKHFPCTSIQRDEKGKMPKDKDLPFGLNLEKGSISEKQPHLHLHCKEMVLPNVSLALQRIQLSSDCDLSKIECLKVVAPLPSHMQRSWDILNS